MKICTKTFCGVAFLLYSMVAFASNLLFSGKVVDQHGAIPLKKLVLG
jgi:hypothetical protein